jgi:hypothetical protein
MSDSQSKMPANPLRRAMSWFRRHRWAVNAALVVLILTLTGLAYGLWDQTQFLTSLNAHPGLEKVSGPRAAGAVAFQKVLWFWILWLLLVCPIQAGFRRIQAVFRRKFKTRRPWNIIFWPLINSVWDVLPASVRIIGRAARGVFCIVIGLYMAANAIDAFVWERALPSGLSVCWVFLFIYAGVNYLLSAVQMGMAIEPRPEDKPASSSQARVFWWGIVLSFGGAWMLSAAQTFTLSKAGLAPLGGGLAVGVSSVLAMFVLSRLSGSRLSGDLFGAESGWGRDATGNLVVASGASSGVAGWKRVYRGMWQWLRGLARIAIACLAILILAIDACVALVMIFGNPSLNPNPSHDGDIFICGLVVGLLLILYKVKMRQPGTKSMGSSLYF